MPTFIETITTRRSTRRFTDEPVDRDSLDQMMKAAISAPSGGNRQPWRFVVVQDRALLTAVKDAIVKGIEALPRTLNKASEAQVDALQRRFARFSLFFADAPVAVFVFYDPTGSVVARVMAEHGAGEAERERDSGLVDAQSAAAAIENLLLAAHSLGYGSCWMNPPFFAREEISRMLGVAPPFRLLAMVPIGRPAEEPRGKSRRPLDEVVAFIG